MTTNHESRGISLQHSDDEKSETTDRFVESNGMSCEELIEYAEGLDQRYSCYAITDNSATRVESDRIMIGDDNLQITNAGWGQLAKEIGAPYSYLSQFDPEFRAQIVQYHVDHLHSPFCNVGDLEAVAFEDRFIGFRRSRLVHLELAAAVRAIFDALGGERQSYSIHQLRVTDDSITMEMMTPRRTHEVQVGDEVQGGISVSHSFLGTHPTTIDLFVYRLMCQNGMTLRHCVGHTEISRSRRLKKNGEESKTAAIEQIKRMVVERLRHQNDLFRSLSQLPGAPLERAIGADDEDSMRRFLMPSLRATHLWSAQLWRRVLAPAWRHAHGGNGELNEFAAVNTITYVATHQRDLSFRQRRTLARLAGLLSFRRVHICPRCNSAVVGS